jgi:hypothetical protein
LAVSKRFTRMGGGEANCLFRVDYARIAVMSGDGLSPPANSGQRNTSISEQARSAEALYHGYLNRVSRVP